MNTPLFPLSLCPFLVASQLSSRLSILSREPAKQPFVRSSVRQSVVCFAKLDRDETILQLTYSVKRATCTVKPRNKEFQETKQFCLFLLFKKIVNSQWRQEYLGVWFLLLTGPLERILTASSFSKCYRGGKVFFCISPSCNFSFLSLLFKFTLF